VRRFTGQGDDPRDHAVQRLPVEVEDPADLAELGDHRVQEGLPAGALVELGVADQREQPAGAAPVPSGLTQVPQGCESRWRRASAPQTGTVAPMPTEPVESTTSESLARLG